MKRVSAIVAAALLALPLPAQDSAWKQEFAKHLKTSREFTIAVAEAMPADGYDFKPNPEEMSFGVLMAHIAIAQATTFGRVAGMDSPLPAKQPEKVDRATALKMLNDSFDFCEKALASATPAQLDAVTGPEGRQTSGREKMWSYFTHTAHHRGQAEVYLRVKGIKPPPYRF
jgi:uncharacterized damage-inducible protein DinB